MAGFDDHGHGQKVHGHDHAHITHYVHNPNDDPEGGDVEHMTSRHEHEHNHPEVEHAHVSHEDQEREHRQEAHIHDHSHPARS
ncbi:MAG: hypothetical protein ACR2HN_13635 [Tepidiformaceae bacterium]